ncbi:MAG: hypothetical protein ACOYJS_00725 [Acutalibacteraceae bacterium]
MVTYTYHAANNSIRYRITEKTYDIFSFGPEHIIDYQYSVTYAQVFENIKHNKIWLFTRVNRVTWEFRYSKDEGETWSDAQTFLKSDAGGLFYFNVRKQLVTEHDTVKERCFFALYGHPRISKAHTIRSGFFDDEGNLLKMNGEKTGVNLFGNVSATQITLNTLDVVYGSPSETTVRLLEVAPTVPLRVGLAAFELNKPETIIYYMATFKDDKWCLSSPIAKGGEFLSPVAQLDGSQTYVGGMACNFGVGEAGLNPVTIGSINTNRVYIARFDGESRVLESYVSYDKGRAYELEQVIRRIPASENIKIWRPTVPI